MLRASRAQLLAHEPHRPVFVEIAATTDPSNKRTQVKSAYSSIYDLTLTDMRIAGMRLQERGDLRVDLQTDTTTTSHIDIVTAGLPVGLTRPHEVGGLRGLSALR
jgi:hypothetical protein